MKKDFYKYNGKVSRHYDKIAELVFADNPQVLDDDMPDFFDSVVEEVELDVCKWCGRQTLFERDFCSKDCMREYLGEP